MTGRFATTALFLAAGCLLAPLVASGQQDESLRVVTFNLLHSGKSLEIRTNAAAALLEAEDPDLIGLQEVSGSWWRKNRAKIIARRLGYDYVYKPSDGVRPVFAEGLACLTRGKIDSSGREKLIHSKIWPFERRFVQWVETRLPSGQRVMLFNTHLTHHDDTAYQVERLEQALEAMREIAERALARDVPAVFVGDFNSHPGHLALRALVGNLLGGPAPFVDVWAAVGSGPGHTDSPRNSHNGSGSGERIDFVLLLQGTTRALQPRSIRLIGEQRVGPAPGFHPSDHFGLSAELILKAAPATTGSSASRTGIAGRLSGRAGASSTGSGPAVVAATPARRASRLRARIVHVERWIAKVRAEERDILEDEAEDDAWHDDDNGPVFIDADELRARVLRRVLARFP